MKKNGKYHNGKKGMSMKPLAILLAMTLLVGGAIGGTLAWLLDTSDTVTNTFSTSDIEITLQEHTYNPATDALTDTITTDGVSNYKMVPGWTIPKDPWVTVKSGSEDCWLFVEIDEVCEAMKDQVNKYNFSDFIVYNVNTTSDDEWTKGTGIGENGNGVPENVYFRQVTDITEEKTFTILAAGAEEHNSVTYSWTDNQVLVKPTVTKQMMEAAKNAQPELSFTAYASQLWKSNNPGEDATPEDIAGAQFTAAQAWTNLGVS